MSALGWLRDRLVDRLTAIPGVLVHRAFSDAPSSIGVVTFTVDGVAPGLVAAYLSAEHGIGVRDGTFCAHPLLARLGLPDGAVRASVGVGTSSRDVDRLVAADPRPAAAAGLGGRRGRRRGQLTVPAHRAGRRPCDTLRQ